MPEKTGMQLDVIEEAGKPRTIRISLPDVGTTFDLTPSMACHMGATLIQLGAVALERERISKFGPLGSVTIA